MISVSAGISRASCNGALSDLIAIGERLSIVYSFESASTSKTRFAATRSAHSPTSRCVRHAVLHFPPWRRAWSPCLSKMHFADSNFACLVSAGQRNPSSQSHVGREAREDGPGATAPPGAPASAQNSLRQFCCAERRVFLRLVEAARSALDPSTRSIISHIIINYSTATRIWACRMRRRGFGRASSSTVPARMRAPARRCPQARRQWWLGRVWWPC